jgi:hypothetical protein
MELKDEAFSLVSQFSHPTGPAPRPSSLHGTIRGYSPYPLIITSSGRRDTASQASTRAASVAK